MHTANVYYSNSHLHSNNKRKKKNWLESTLNGDFSAIYTIRNLQIVPAENTTLPMADRERNRERYVFTGCFAAHSFARSLKAINKASTKKQKHFAISVCYSLSLVFFLQNRDCVCAVRICKVRDLNSNCCCSCNQTLTYTQRAESTLVSSIFIIFLFQPLSKTFLLFAKLFFY